MSDGHREAVTGGRHIQGSRLGTEDFVGYLATLYFGRPRSRSAYIRRAYRDLNRTLHTEHEGRSQRVDDCVAVLEDAIETAAATQSISADVNSFDRWHGETCVKLIDTFGPEMAYGQAQKWLNMTVKYSFTAHALGLLDLGHLEQAYRYAHIPIDRIVIQRLREDNEEHPFQTPFPAAWSQMNRDQYIALQQEVRDRYLDPPLEVEFRLWRFDGDPPRKRETDVG